MEINLGDGDSANSTNEVLSLDGEDQSISIPGYKLTNDDNRFDTSVLTTLPLCASNGNLKYHIGGKQLMKAIDLGTLDASNATSMSIGDPIPYQNPGTGDDPLDGLLYEGSINNLGINGGSTFTIQLEDNVADILQSGDEFNVQFKCFSIQATCTFKFKYTLGNDTKTRNIPDSSAGSLSVTTDNSNDLVCIKFQYFERDAQNHGIWPISAYILES